MNLSSKKIADAVYIRLTAGEGFDMVIKDLEDFLNKNHLSQLKESILYFVDRKLKEENDKNTAKIKVSHDFDHGTVDKISSLIKKQDSHRVDVEVDESLIGGFSALYKGVNYELSIKRYLQDLREQLVK
ncbi:MAG: F0F1 ATP synthase subunit delta [Candidatus Paceibacterota bacterium]